MTPADPTDPHVWLNRAYSNLLLTEKDPGKDVMVEDRLRPLQQWDHGGKQYSKMVLHANSVRMLDCLKDNRAGGCPCR